MLCSVIPVQEIYTRWNDKEGFWTHFRDQVSSCDARTLQGSSSCAWALFRNIGQRRIIAWAPEMRASETIKMSGIHPYVHMIWLCCYDFTLNGRMRTCHQYNLLSFTQCNIISIHWFYDIICHRHNHHHHHITTIFVFTSSFVPL